jgi:putative pyruvate formate lyase activating enzyme
MTVKKMLDFFERSIKQCNLCPRKCLTNRYDGELGYCKVGADPLVASITIHRGEEPVISGTKGICNIFFAHCNLVCSFCQNFQISRNNSLQSNWIGSYSLIVDLIIDILENGIDIIGFVSPTHQVYQMVKIIDDLHQRGYHPTVVYNTNCYDNPELLRELDGIVDVYLPDIKYYDDNLAKKYSDAPEYFNIAMAALKEMIWQKGTSIRLKDNGLIESGVILRHLVLPGLCNDSINIFNELEKRISNSITISLMSQYYPVNTNIPDKSFQRKVGKNEFESVIKTIEKLGFIRGWIQDLSSSNYYLPNFLTDTPFKS